MLQALVSYIFYINSLLASFHLLRSLFDEYIFYLIETKFASLVTQQPQILPQQYSVDFPQQVSWLPNVLIRKHHPEFHGVERYVMQNDDKAIHTDEDYALMMSNIQSMNRNFHKVPSLGVDDMSKLNQYVGSIAFYSIN